MRLALNSISTMHCTFQLDARIARETGYEGLFLVGSKLSRYLAEGYTSDDAKRVLAGLPLAGIGHVRDIDRCSVEAHRLLLEECEAMCQMAQSVGCASVQLLTGPLDPNGTYKGPGDLPWPQLRSQVAANVAELGAIGARYGVSFYLEPLAWTPLRRLDQAVEILDAAERDNVGLALDFWHLWHSGARPDDLAALDPALIRTIDFGDAIGEPGVVAGADQRGRRVWPGDGAIPLREWVDAIRSTGYDGWWTAELLSPPHWELDPWQTAGDLRRQLADLVA